MSREDRERLEQVVVVEMMEAVNRARPGELITGSEEAVRDLGHELVRERSISIAAAIPSREVPRVARRRRSQTIGIAVNMRLERNCWLNKESTCAEQSNNCGAVALRA